MIPIKHTEFSVLRRTLAGLVIAGLLPGLAAAQTSLTPHTAEYKIKISVLGGELQTRLAATDNGYVATHEVRPTGMSRMLARGTISESSAFTTAPDGIRPTTYRSDDSLSRDKGQTYIEFDWSINEAKGTVNDAAVKSAMQGLAYDRVSIQYELMHDLMNGGPSANYVLFDIDRLKTIHVSNIGSRTVKVPAGRFEAIGITHQAEGSKRITTMWCVPELDFLPVIIEQHRKGKLRVRAVLKNYEPTTT
ncbi:MAG: DUF3108 domain-containing protein [Gammaproteobacteria bacterium]|nr:DUF3108 domain-containing protein [Gammaproteobacteria bacterium]